MDVLKEVAHRQYKDRLFKAIFENRVYLLSLYNAVNRSQYTDPDALDVNTIENSVYVGMHNDLSFIFHSELSLYEQQSSYNPNMPLRGMLYFARLYEKVLTQRHKDVYNSRLVKIPTPKYVVFYNGQDIKPDLIELKLSDAFEVPDSSGKFQWTATMLNINKGHNKKLMEHCKALEAYAEYVARVRRNIKDGMDKTGAIDEALDWAAKEDILNGFFRDRKSEVKAMSITEFDLDEYGMNRWSEGREEGRISLIVSLDKQGFPREAIATAAGLTVAQVDEIIEKNAVTA